ncbi:MULTISPECIES: membrane protein insertion efficiency factor YidD [Gracilibacillus]|uniref:membrane protein insertion efficiency factor YidD n=1 Tax=Gracilibacillus TaxID=74385 RepID=UPI00098FE3D1|nr:MULTISPECIES: membrane protein insertion efficiency factor YidD [Gracilibacillus]
MRRIFIGIIRFYQRFISPLFPPTCRFHPSCSNYSLECFRRFPVWKAIYLTIKRVIKCHPFHPGGFDPVPEKKTDVR